MSRKPKRDPKRADKRKNPAQADRIKATRWKPGQSGNPAGPGPLSPRGYLRKLRVYADLPAPQEWRDSMKTRFPEHAAIFDSATLEDVVAWTSIKEACAANYSFHAEFVQRIAGRSTLNVSLETPEKSPGELDDPELDRVIRDIFSATSAPADSG